MERISNNSYNSLIQVMEGFFKLSPKFKVVFKSMLYETTYKKGARIVNSGSKQKVIWFMLDGLAREIRVHNETFEENTGWFWFSLSFLYTSPGFFNNTSSKSTIEILEDCRVVLISYEDLVELKKGFGETELVIERIRGEYDNIRLLYADDIRNLSTDERYLKHEKTLDILFGRTQLRFIAEYMGMSPDTLGKLRKKYSGVR